MKRNTLEIALRKRFEHYGKPATEARLRECIVIIRTAYQDMREGPGKRMAKFFLESQGYEQLVKYLDGTNSNGRT